LNSSSRRGHETIARRSIEPRGEDRRIGPLATTMCLWNREAVDGNAERGDTMRLPDSSLVQLVGRLACDVVVSYRVTSAFKFTRIYEINQAHLAEDGFSDPQSLLHTL
jgi:hypothetical protein